MSILVLDSSVAISWFIPDETTMLAQQVLERVGEAGAVVPPLWFVEVGNALLFSTRRKRIRANDCANAIATLEELPIERDVETFDHAWNRTFRLAAQFGLTLYDACYLELAHRRDLPLASLDRQLRTAASKMKIDLLGL